MIETYIIFLIYFYNVYYEPNYEPSIKPMNLLLVSDLEPFIETQKHAINVFENVLVEKKNSFDLIRRELRRIQMEHQKAKGNLKLCLENPISYFTLIKRMTKDLDIVINITNQGPGITRNDSLKYPSHEDMNETIRMIVRLQRVYQLNVTQLANGLLLTSFSEDGKTYNEVFLPMTSSDCFNIGKRMCQNNDPKPGIPWLFESLRLFNKKKPVLGLSETDIVQFISNGYEALNKSAEASVWLRRLLHLTPKNNTDKILQLKVKLGLHLKKVDKKCTKSRKKQTNNKSKNERRSKRVVMRKKHRILCRGEVDVAHNIRKRLKCWYFTGYHPFSKLAPFKAEQKFVRPGITLIHNALSEKEIQVMKHKALPKLQTYTQMDFLNAKTIAINVTVLLKAVAHRISDMTGFQDDNQVLLIKNFGVGGHFKCHLDSIGYEKIANKMVDKYAGESLTFYLSDVEQGGATVFHELALRVFPVKGAAIMWRNYLPTGEVDEMMYHSVCPVLRGSRWTATKFFDGSKQELRKPCTKRFTSRSPKEVPMPVFLKKHKQELNERNKMIN